MIWSWIVQGKFISITYRTLLVVHRRLLGRRRGCYWKIPRISKYCDYRGAIWRRSCKQLHLILRCRFFPKLLLCEARLISKFKFLWNLWKASFAALHEFPCMTVIIYDQHDERMVEAWRKTDKAECCRAYTLDFGLPWVHSGTSESSWSNWYDAVGQFPQVTITFVIGLNWATIIFMLIGGHPVELWLESVTQFADYAGYDNEGKRHHAIGWDDKHFGTRRISHSRCCRRLPRHPFLALFSIHNSSSTQQVYSHADWSWSQARLTISQEHTN